MNTLTINTAELLGQPLDWAFAKSQKLHSLLHVKDGMLRFKPAQFSEEEIYSPSRNFDHLEEAIESYGISTVRCNHECHRHFPDKWAAEIGSQSYETSTEHQSHDPMILLSVDSLVYGPTMQVAACRAVVLRELGKTVDVPSDLVAR